MVFQFTAREDLKRRLERLVFNADKDVGVGGNVRKYVEQICDRVAGEPYGIIVVYDFRLLDERMSKIFFWVISWIVLRGEKQVSVRATHGWRTAVSKAGPDLMKCRANRMDAFSLVDPSRAGKLISYLTHRKLRPAVAHLPKPPAWLEIVFPDVGGLVLVRGGDGEWYVGTPSGWFRVSEQMRARTWRCQSAWLLLRDLGISVPRRKDKRKWSEEMAAQLALLVLAG